MPDLNTHIAYNWANELGAPPLMPKSLEDPLKRAQFVHFLDVNVTVGSEFWEYDKEKKAAFLTENERGK